MPNGSRNIRLWIAGAAACFACLAGPVATAISAPPTPTPASVGPPDSVAVLGDSISAGTGTAGLPSAEQPANSWATGTNASVNSVYQRLVAINPAASGNNYNQASNGKKMTDMAGQASSMPANTELVLLQMGGNDLCKDTVAQMTSLADYRSQFVAGLNAIASRNPNALINVSSIPDIFNLWFLRGAPNPPNSQPSSRASTARLFWDTLAVIPCKSLVDNPTDMSADAIARRDAVRQRDLDFNAILEEECALRLRCRFDNYATFDFSSNRPTRTSPDYLPRADWQFVDDDISTIDHFHPSLSGHTKLARVAWEAGRNFTDTTHPTVASASKSPAPLGNGTSVVPTTVNVNYTDAAGIRGIEWRTHSGAATTAWSTTLSPSVSLQVSQTGTTYVETRALDVNGNMSASRIDTVNYDPNAIPAPTISSGPAAQVNTSSASVQFSGDAGLTFECSLDGAAYAACSSPLSLTGLSDALHTLNVRQTAGVGVNGPASSRSWTVDTASPASPSLNSPPSGFVSSKAASLSFTGEAGAAFECSISGTGGPWTACSSPKSYTGLPEGAASFAVRQTDPAGNTGSPAVASWTVDTVSPFAPVVTGIPSAPTNSTSAQISFSGEASAVFQCRLDSANFAPCTSPVQLTSLGHGNHAFSVKQVDQAGNTSPAAGNSWTVDTAVPQTPSITGGPAPVTSSSSASITFTGEPGAVFTCSLDSGTFVPCTSPRNLSGLGDGSHALAVRQTDQAGNTSASATRSWLVDSNASPPELTGQPPSPTKSRNATFAFTGKPGSTFKCSVDGAGFQACTSPVNLTDLADGVRTFAVTQTDLANNTSDPASASWTVDTTAPAKPSIEALADVVHATRNLTINFTGESGATFECRTDAGPWGTCSSPLSLSLPSDGQHTLEVRQTDAAGNTGPSDGVTLRVDTVAPGAPSIESAPTGFVAKTTATVSMTGEPGATFECRVGSGGWDSCLSPWLVSSLPQGPVSVAVRQLDEAGNAGPPATAGWTVDSVTPAAPVISGAPTGTVRSDSAGLTLGGEPGASFECRLNGGDWSACSSPWALSSLPQGAQAAEARQTDQAGNTGPAASAGWIVDTVAPALTGKPAAKKKSGKWRLTTKHKPSWGKPSKLEYSTSKKKPSATAKPVSSKTKPWAAKLTIKSKKKPVWVRVTDAAGNLSAWSRVR